MDLNSMASKHTQMCLKNVAFGINKNRRNSRFLMKNPLFENATSFSRLIQIFFVQQNEKFFQKRCYISNRARSIKNKRIPGIEKKIKIKY